MDRTGRSSFSVLDNVMKERCNRVAQAWGIPLAYILFRDIFLCKSSISALIKIKLTYSLYSDWRNHSSLICYLKNHLSTDAMTTFCYINQARISEKCWPIWFCPGVRVHKGITIIPSLCRSHWLAVVYCLFLCSGSCEPVHEDNQNLSWFILFFFNHGLYTQIEIKQTFPELQSQCYYLSVP